MLELINAPAGSPPGPGLAELVERIAPRARATGRPRDDRAAVADVLAELNPGPELLSEAERAGSPDGYTRRTLPTEATFSLQAVVWRPGQITEIHDHLVWCSFIVLQGFETDTLYSIDGSAWSPSASDSGPRARSAAPRRPTTFTASATGDTVAITLHVYGADLSQGTSVRRTYHQRPEHASSNHVDPRGPRSTS